MSKDVERILAEFDAEAKDLRRIRQAITDGYLPASMAKKTDAVEAELRRRINKAGFSSTQIIGMQGKEQAQ